MAQVVDKVQLRAGDSVEMLLATDARTGNRTGRLVRRTSQTAAPSSADGLLPGGGPSTVSSGLTPREGSVGGGTGLSSGTGAHHGVKEKKPQQELKAERNPNAVKYIGHKVVRVTVRHPYRSR